MRPLSRTPGSTLRTFFALSQRWRFTFRNAASRSYNHIPARSCQAGTRPPRAGATRLFVNAGRASGVRPQDIVGALANESGLTGRDIGAIQIHERHSLVEIPEHAADDVLRSLRGATTLKGRKANIRRDRGFAPTGAPRRGGRHE